MALPIRPGQGLPTNRPVDKPAPSAEVLPSLPALPEALPTPEVAPKQNRERPAKVAAPKAQRAESTVETPAAKHDPNWELDPKTGKRYKRIAGYKDGVMNSRQAVKNVAKGNISMEQLRMMVKEEPDFNLDDLNGSADTFLAHLRVPPNKEEQAKLREERAARQKQYDEQASRAAAEEAEESDY
jgi:hypothetical protein